MRELLKSRALWNTNLRAPKPTCTALSKPRAYAYLYQNRYPTKSKYQLPLNASRMSNHIHYTTTDTKNLPKNKEMNISPELNVKKEAQPTLGIEEYLKGLREGVGL